MKQPRVICLLLAAVAAGCLAASAAELSNDRLVELAERFSRQFTEGRHEANLELMDDTMRSASGPGPSETLRKALIGQNGAVTGVGAGWFEDKLQGYRRVRVPVTFEEATFDFRVVFDGKGRLAGFFIQPHAEPPVADDSGPGRRILVRVGPGERALPGTLTLPDEAGPHPAVVLIQGSGPSDRDLTVGPNKPFRDLAWGLAQRGVASLRYDKRSYARPDDLVALGGDLTVQHEVIEDARSALALLREREEIDASRLYVVGLSLGGTLAPRIAMDEPRPAGLISLAGSTLPLPEKTLKQQRYIFSLDGEIDAAEQTQLDALAAQVTSLRAALDGESPAPDGNILGAPFGYYADLERTDAPGQAAALGLPILVLQGERDYQVTLEDFAQWKGALADKAFACLASYGGLDHLFRAGSGPSGPADYERQAGFDPRVIDDIAGWIDNRRCPGDQS